MVTRDVSGRRSLRRLRPSSRLRLLRRSVTFSIVARLSFRRRRPAAARCFSKFGAVWISRAPFAAILTVDEGDGCVVGDEAVEQAQWNSAGAEPSGVARSEWARHGSC